MRISSKLLIFFKTHLKKFLNIFKSFWNLTNFSFCICNWNPSAGSLACLIARFVTLF